MHFSRLTLLQLAAQILLRIRPETSMTDAPILSVGDGAVYEVLHLGTCEDTGGHQACDADVSHSMGTADCPPSEACFGLRYDRVAIRSAASTTSTTLEIKQTRGQRTVCQCVSPCSVWLGKPRNRSLQSTQVLIRRSCIVPKHN